MARFRPAQPRTDRRLTDYTSTLSLADAAKRLDAASRISLLTHAKPDGDAFGSLVALGLALQAQGRAIAAAFVPPVPDAFRDLAGAWMPTITEDPSILGDCDLLVIVDTGAKSQLGAMLPYAEARLDRTLIIDHHLSGDLPAAARYIDGAAAACCEIIAELLDAMGPASTRTGSLVESPGIAAALFAGIASDTGWFRFSNVRPQTHQLAARLLAAGVDHADLYRQLEQQERPEKLRLLIRALDSLELLPGDAAALMCLTVADFAETGAREEETERLIDIPQQVGSIQVIALLSEKQTDDGIVTRISLRSKPQRPGGPEPVNVAELAARLGGGGHARAAGARLDGPITETRPRVREALAAAR